MDSIHYSDSVLLFTNTIVNGSIVRIVTRLLHMRNIAVRSK